MFGRVFYIVTISLSWLIMSPMGHSKHIRVGHLNIVPSVGSILHVLPLASGPQGRVKGGPPELLPALIEESKISFRRCAAGFH